MTKGFRRVANKGLVSQYGAEVMYFVECYHMGKNICVKLNFYLVSFIMALKKSILLIIFTFASLLSATEAFAQVNDFLGDLTALEQDIETKDQEIEKQFQEAQEKKAKSELLSKNQARMDHEIAKLQTEKERTLAGYSHMKPSFSCKCFFTLCLTTGKKPTSAQVNAKAQRRVACKQYRELLDKAGKPYDDRIRLIRDSSGTKSEEELNTELVELETQSLNPGISTKEIAELDAAVDSAIASQKYSADQAKRLEQEQANAELKEGQQRLDLIQQEINDAEKREREAKAKAEARLADRQRNLQAFCSKAAAKGQTPCPCIPPEERNYVCK